MKFGFLTRPCLISALVVLTTASLQAGNIDNTSVTVGTQEIVLQNYWYGAFTSLPDVAAPSEWLPNGNLRLWIPVIGGSVCGEGPDLKHISYKSFALRPGPPGEFDDNYAGLCGSILKFPNGKYYGAYHGDNGGTPNTSGVSPTFSGFWQCVGAAVSEDGYSFKRIGKIIQSWEPQGTVIDSGTNTIANGGAQHPSMAFSRDGKYVYCYYLDYTYSIQGWMGGLTFPWSMARSKVSDGMAPGSWSKYYHPYTPNYNTNDLSFCSFSEPGLNSQPASWPWVSANFSSINYPTTLLSNNAGGWIMHSVRYITNSRTYLATLISGSLYYALSSNGIHWTPAKKITNSVIFAPGFNVIYPTFIQGPGCSPTNISGWIFYGAGTNTAVVGHVGGMFPINITAPGPIETTPLVNPAVVWYSIPAETLLLGSNIDAGTVRAFDPDSGFESGYGVTNLRYSIRPVGGGNPVFTKNMPLAPYEIGNLSTSSWPSGRYEIRVEAFSDPAAGGETAIYLQTNFFSNTGLLPETPFGVSVVPLTSTKMEVSWGESANELAYLVYRGNQNDFSKAVLTLTLPANETLATLGNLSADTPYYFWVKSSNGFGVSPPSLAASGRTLPVGDLSIPQDGGRPIFINADTSGMTSNGVVKDAREIWLNTTNFSAQPGRTSFQVRVKVTTPAAAFPGVTIPLSPTIDLSGCDYFSLETYIQDWTSSMFSNSTMLFSRLYQGAGKSTLNWRKRVDDEFVQAGTWMQMMAAFTNNPRNAVDKFNFYFSSDVDVLTPGLDHLVVVGNMRAYRTNLIVQNLKVSKSFSGDLISWSNSGAVSYALEYSPDKRSFIPLASGISGTSYLRTGTSPLTNHFYRVAVEVSNEAQMFSSPESTRTPAPSRPVLTATAVSSTQVDLQWNKAVGSSGYAVYQGTTADINGAKELASYGSNQFSHSVKNLSPATVYYFWVAGKFGNVSSASEPAIIKTPGPSDLNFRNRIAGINGDLELELAPRLLLEGRLDVRIFQVSGAPLPVRLAIQNGKIRWNGYLDNGQRAQVGNYILALSSEKKNYRAAFLLVW